MSERDKRAEGMRGWSLVFDDRTAEAPPPKDLDSPEDLDAQKDRDGDADTDQHRLPVGETVDQATVIDEGIARQLERELNALRRDLAEDATQPPDDDTDDRMQNVPVSQVMGVPLDPVELTVRAPRPDISGVPPPPKKVPRDDRTIEDLPREDLHANAEPTRRAPIPYELLLEHSLPQIDRGGAKLVITRRAISAAPPPEPKPVPEPASAAEQTMIDLAAVLGMAPEPSRKGAASEESTDVPLPAPPAPMPIAIDLEPLLEEPKPGAHHARSKAPPPKGPREGADAGEIRGWLAGADSLARTIPILIGVFVVLATVAISIMLFSAGRDAKQQHVELHFLSLSGRAGGATRSDHATTRVIVETVPPGLIVLHDRKILGKTPIEVDLPVVLEERVGVELSGPYYERWLGEVKRDVTGEYRIVVELAKRR